MRKSRAIIMLIVLLVCSLIFVMTACVTNGDGNNDKDKLPLHKHTWSEEYFADDNGHYHICTTCGGKSDIDEHLFEIKKDSVTEDTHTVICEVCDYRIVEEPHNFIVKSDDFEHWLECAVCKLKKDFEVHNYADKYDEDYHWKVCQSCGFTTHRTPYTKGLSFKLSTDENSYIVTGIGSVNDKKIEIPSIYKGKPVTSIASRAFSHSEILEIVVIPNNVISIEDSAFFACSKLRKVVISNDVQIIGDSAFAYCGSLNYVSIGDGVKSIGKRAFEGCSFLDEIVIGTNVESIGDNAFIDCKFLKRITIPVKVSNIGDGVFKNCDELESITVADGNINYKSVDNCLLSKDGKYLIAGCKNSIIPSGVTTIGTSAFEGCSGITSIQLPDTVTSIGDFAFSECDELTEIIIPNSVVSIGADAFNACAKLETIKFLGVKNDWDAITKGSNWNNDTNAFVIICTDGKLDKDGLEVE